MTRSTRLLVLVSSGISFFLGLQFCHLTVTELFQISSIDIDATDYIARAPDKVIESVERERNSNGGDLYVYDSLRGDTS